MYARIAKLLLLLSIWTVSLADQHSAKLLALTQQKYGIQARETVSQWQAMIVTAKDQGELAKLMAANDFFNTRVTFTTDDIAWGSSDYWATPIETMGNARGDCEDFSIAKYISLLKMGVALQRLRLIYVKVKLPNGGSAAHMVLAYYAQPGADPLILDNISKDIVPASRRKDLVPVFSFNSAGLWVGNNSEPKIKKPETRLSRWRDVLLRMQAEGIH